MSTALHMYMYMYKARQEGACLRAPTHALTHAYMRYEIVVKKSVEQY